MPDLTYEDLERLIGEICSGKKLVFLSNGAAKEIPLMFKHPSHRDKELSTFIYRRAIKEAEAMELPTMEEMVGMVKTRGLFSAQDEEKLAVLEGKLEGQRLLLAKTTRVPANRERINSIINRLESEILEIKLKRERLFDFTRERKATEEKLLYLAWCGALDPFSGELYWPNYDIFKDEEDFVFRKRVFIEYTLYFYGVDQKTMREIARSNLWRIRYVHTLKTGAGLFDCPMVEYSVDQLMLCYWSNYYQSIYEMLSDDRPPDSIIEDDAALDAYMKDWAAERNRQDTAGRSKKKQYGKPSAWDHNEVLVTKANEMHEDIQYSKTLADQGLDKGKTSKDEAAFGRGKKRK